MSLLPIIYTSILIFGALLLFVLITSYISYKVKQSGKLATDGRSTAMLKIKGSYPKLQNNFTPQRAHNNPVNIDNRKKQSEFPRTKSVYYKEEREIGNRKIDVIYREKSLHANQRLTRVNRLNPSEEYYNNFQPEPDTNYVISDYRTKRIQENEILKYYEDF